MEEGFKPTQAVKIMEGDTEKVFPVYDLGILRAGIMFTDEIPPGVPEHVKENCERVKTRLIKSDVTTQEPLAIVGYGPTLKRFWPQIRNFGNIMSTSGAHKFLIEKDIIPTYHVDVDFRERKAVHTNPSHPDIKYYMSSWVHPKTIDNVINRQLALWHVK